MMFESTNLEIQLLLTKAKAPWHWAAPKIPDSCAKWRNWSISETALTIIGAPFRKLLIFFYPRLKRTGGAPPSWLDHYTNRIALRKHLESRLWNIVSSYFEIIRRASLGQNWEQRDCLQWEDQWRHLHLTWSQHLHQNWSPRSRYSRPCRCYKYY